MTTISNFIIPLLIIAIVLYGMFKKVDVYQSFLSGAKEGLKTVFNIFPAILAMIFAVNIFLKSNFLDFFLKGLNPILNMLNIPAKIIPMALLRPISGTASLAILNDLLTNFGPDSFVGRLGSTIQGATDTTVYILALYFSSIKIKKTRHALPAGLFADLVGMITSFIVVKLLFY